MVEVDDAISHEVEEFVAARALPIFRRLHGEDCGHVVVNQPIVQDVEFIPFARRIIEEAQEDVQGVYHDPVGLHGRGFSVDDGDQALQVELPGENRLWIHVSLHQEELAGLLQGR